MAERDYGDVGSAWRRRGRQLRYSCCMSGCLCACSSQKHSHHSAGPSTKKVVQRRERQEEVEFETHAAPRRQNTPPPSRPGVLDLGPLWVEAVTVGYEAASSSWVRHRWLIRGLKPSMVAPSATSSRRTWRGRGRRRRSRSGRTRSPMTSSLFPSANPAPRDHERAAGTPQEEEGGNGGA